MSTFPIPPNNTRIGFHYYPDTIHYRESDLQNWLPELRSLGTSWLALLAPADRAIPEGFLMGLLSNGIEPVLHFTLPLQTPPPVKDLNFLLETYARWGVHYIILFDRPNSRSAWCPTAWAQSDLVERFLDRFIPLAETACQSGLIPVFSPLTPGGDYWDTSFLRFALQAIERRGHYHLLDHLALSAYAEAGDRPLNWGCGGPERWPDSRPYATPAGGQDQRGFRIFDWYIAISQAVIGEVRPLLLLGLRSWSSPKSKSTFGQDTHLRRTLAMAQALAAGSLPRTFSQVKIAPEEPLEPLPPEVLAGHFWLLTASSNNPLDEAVWYRSGIIPQPSVRALRQLAASLIRPIGAGKKSIHCSERIPVIQHYLLLPSFDWGVADWYLQAARPFIKRHLPTVGFSLAEAAQATRVTVVGGSQFFSDEDLANLRASGCIVERINGDGMSIATQLADR
jgi:hypothetical protein